MTTNVKGMPIVKGLGLDSFGLVANACTVDIDEERVSKHFMSNTGTTTFEWAPGFAPASASELAKGLHALTWNDRPLDQWS